MKYKVGDKIRVRKDLKDGTRYNGCWVVHPMSTFAGKVATIRTVRDEVNRYYIANSDLNWSDDMFEGLAKPQYYVCKRPTNYQGNPLWKKFIAHLNTFTPSYQTLWEGTLDSFYGYDGNPNYGGTDWHDRISSFQNNPTVLTLEEWDRLFNSEEEETKTTTMPKTYSLTRIQLLEIRGRMGCSTIRKQIDEYLKQNYQKRDLDPIAIGVPDIERLKTEATVNDRNVIKEYLDIEDKTYDVRINSTHWCIPGSFNLTENKKLIIEVVDGTLDARIETK